jgi:hypothetical protein
MSCGLASQGPFFYSNYYYYYYCYYYYYYYYYYTPVNYIPTTVTK